MDTLGHVAEKWNARRAVGSGAELNQTKTKAKTMTMTMTNESVKHEQVLRVERADCCACTTSVVSAKLAAKFAVGKTPFAKCVALAFAFASSAFVFAFVSRCRCCSERQTAIETKHTRVNNACLCTCFCMRKRTYQVAEPSLSVSQCARFAHAHTRAVQFATELTHTRLCSTRLVLV